MALIKFKGHGFQAPMAPFSPSAEGAPRVPGLVIIVIIIGDLAVKCGQSPHVSIITMTSGSCQQIFCVFFFPATPDRGRCSPHFTVAMARDFVQNRGRSRLTGPHYLNGSVIMKIRIITLAWAAFFVFLGTLASFSASTMTNDDVVKLVKAGLSEPVILAAIDECDPRFDVTPDGLVKLKTAGVTDGVIQRMIAKKPGPSAAPAPVLKGGDCRLSAPETLQPVLDGTRQVNLGFREPEFDEEVTAGSTLASFFTLGIAPEKGVYLGTDIRAEGHEPD